MPRKIKKIFIILLLILAVIFGFALLSQILLPHKDISFVPDYEKISLNENSTEREIFLQTGLSKSAAEKIIYEGGIEKLREYQDNFFAQREVYCEPLLGFVTKSDSLTENSVKPQLADVQKGDILITLSNHTLGWRHGHAGIAIGEYDVIESAILGSDSEIYNISDWQSFSQFAILRLKNVTPEKQNEISDFAEENLVDVPYNLTSGFFGKKAADMNNDNFGVHCSYLVWYAYNNFGFDIDSDGGRLVSSKDILLSDELEIVQIYGLDPRDFI